MTDASPSPSAGRETGEEETTASRAGAGPAAGVRFDLGALYAEPAEAGLSADLDQALEAARGFADHHRGRLAALTAAELAGALDAYEAIQERLARAASYAQLRFAADTASAANGALLQRVQERGTEIRSLLLFFELEWVAVDEARAEALMGDPALTRRRHLLRALRRYRPHLLSEPEERILEETANTGERAFARLFDEIMGAASFPVEIEGHSQELSEEETLALLYDASREKRRAAARGLTTGLQRHARILAFIFNTLVQGKAVEDRLRHYPDPMAARHLANEIEPAAVDALLAACDRSQTMVQRYYRLKAKLLGFSPLRDYDRYAPLAETTRQMGFEAARETVLGAYADFSPKMAEIARPFFERGWIDAELRPGKRGGAFSASTVPSAHPFVMLSYTGSLRDVMTLAHELGHGVHQWLARERGLFEQDAPLTLAETASVFGEMLVFRRLMREEEDPKARLALLCGKLEDAFATVFRQVVMTRFEQKLHAARRQQGELPIERVNALWVEANRPMLGDAVEMTEDYGWWWLYIPHFVHTPFYCYAYAFGELLVLALVRRFDEEGEAFIPRYLELLRAGGSEPPADLLARLDMDVTDPDFWNGGLRILDEMVDAAERLAAETSGT